MVRVRIVEALGHSLRGERLDGQDAVAGAVLRGSGARARARLLPLAPS
jgi:hypothetical protein